MQPPRILAVLSFAIAAFATACSTAPQIDARRDAAFHALAPTGKLRVGVYTGSPTSYVPGEGGKPARGIAYELGALLAKDAGVPYEPVIFPSNEKVFEAFRAGALDVVFTNATAARAQFIDFTPAVLEVEKGYLVPPRSQAKDGADVDRAGVRVGVSRASTTETELGKILANATMVPMPSLAEGAHAVADGRIDAYASNKAILFEMSDGLPGSRVVGNWGTEAFAFGIPKGRQAALAYLAAFVEQERRRGSVRAAAERAGVRGLKK
jgi:polar amino acid transport system substrate-binding protein